jgi:hypothetical protein
LLVEQPDHEALPTIRKRRIRDDAYLKFCLFFIGPSIPFALANLFSPSRCRIVETNALRASSYFGGFNFEQDSDKPRSALSH